MVDLGDEREERQQLLLHDGSGQHGNNDNDNEGGEYDI